MSGADSKRPRSCTGAQTTCAFAASAALPDGRRLFVKRRMLWRQVQVRPGLDHSRECRWTVVRLSRFPSQPHLRVWPGVRFPRRCWRSRQTYHQLGRIGAAGRREVLDVSDSRFLFCCGLANPRVTNDRFAAEMAQRCTLGAWTTNSQVVTAVSDTPTGPYVRQAIAIPPWSHNPE